MIQSNFVPQLLDDFGDPVFGQRVLVAGLRCGKQVQSLQALVANERLRKLCHAVDDVDQIKDHASLGSQHEVEVAQPDIEIDDDDFRAVMGESGTQGSR